MLLARVSRDGLPEQSYAYDKTYPILGRRSLIDPTGDTAAITEDTEWDRNLRPSTIVRANGGRQETIELGYDAAGRQTFAQLTQPDGTVVISETFDAYGRPLSRAYEVATDQGSYAGSLGFTWRENGQLGGVTYPSGNTVTYDYDKSTGHLQSIVAGGAAVFEAQRLDASGRALSLRLDDGAIEVARVYDDAGREQERRIDGVASATRLETYGYDDHGRLRTITAIEGAAATNTIYGYDARDRLISETHRTRGGATRLFTYGYDPVTGLRTTKSDSDGSTATTTEYGYTSGNRLASVGTTPIAWDGYGRQTGDAEGRTFRWGLADQLLAIDEGGANLETNWHDAAGLRVAGTSAGGMEFFLAGPGGELLERRAGGDAAGTVDYVRLPGGIVVATIDQKGAVTPVLNGITGSPYRIGELSAKDLHYEDASGFGEIINTDGRLDEPLAFHQMLDSAANGILVAGVRAYDVTTGRFLSADPLQLAAAPSAIDAADFFRYAQDNPVAMHDATGLAPCLQTPEGGCRSNLGEETYEELRQAAQDHYVAEEIDKARVEHDRFVLEWESTIRKGGNPFDLLPRVSDGAEAEAAESTDARSPSEIETPSEPVTKAEPTAQRRGSRAAGRSRLPDTPSSVDAVTEIEENIQDEEIILSTRILGIEQYNSRIPIPKFSPDVVPIVLEDGSWFVVSAAEEPWARDLVASGAVNPINSFESFGLDFGEQGLEPVSFSSLLFGPIVMPLMSAAAPAIELVRKHTLAGQLASLAMQNPLINTAVSGAGVVLDDAGLLMGASGALRAGLSGVSRAPGSSGIPLNARNNAAGVAFRFADLAPDQMRLLDDLPNVLSETIVHKRAVNVNDLAALTAATGDEFAMFTLGSRRLIVRGTGGAPGTRPSVPISSARAGELAAQGWRWTAHTHPGTGLQHLLRSSGDIRVLQTYFPGQQQSLILNSVGSRNVWNAGGDMFVPGR